jgi:hypothetical protein
MLEEKFDIDLLVKEQKQKKKTQSKGLIDEFIKISDI